MWVVQFKCSEKLFVELAKIKKGLSFKEKTNVTFSEMIEDALMGHFGIKLSDMNQETQIQTIKEQQTILILRALYAAKNLKEAAKKLGLNPDALSKRIKSLGIIKEEGNYKIK